MHVLPLIQWDEKLSLSFMLQSSWWLSLALIFRDQTHPSSLHFLLPELVVIAFSTIAWDSYDKKTDKSNILFLLYQTWAISVDYLPLSKLAATVFWIHLRVTCVKWRLRGSLSLTTLQVVFNRSQKALSLATRGMSRTVCMLVDVILYAKLSTLILLKSTVPPIIDRTNLA